VHPEPARRHASALLGLPPGGLVARIRTRNRDQQAVRGLHRWRHGHAGVVHGQHGVGLDRAGSPTAGVSAADEERAGKVAEAVDGGHLGGEGRQERVGRHRLHVRGGSVLAGELLAVSAAEQRQTDDGVHR